MSTNEMDMTFGLWIIYKKAIITWHNRQIFQKRKQLKQQ